MATNLYETLEIPNTATPEQIRKAYKKKALQTHPDRLPVGATPEDKAASEEQFRKVNNAYEVLNNVQNRRMYDLHGTWPPPELESVPLHRRSSESRHRSPHTHYHSSRSPPFADPFFEQPHDRFSFTDPFTLFESIFGNLNAHHNGSHFYHHHNHAGPSRHDPFERTRRMHSEFDGFHHGLFPSPLGSFFGMPAIMSFPSIEPASFSDGNRGGWAAESFMTTTINGITQAVHKRRDWDGNEHITRTYPDGREVRTINGVEQPSHSRGYITQHSGGSESHHQAHPESVSQSHITGSRSAGPAPPSYPPPQYTSQSRANGYASPLAEPEYNRRHNRRHSETRPVIPEPYTSGIVEDSSRKRWWRGGR